jgi:hypothetical protein
VSWAVAIHADHRKHKIAAEHPAIEVNDWKIYLVEPPLARRMEGLAARLDEFPTYR